MAALSGHNEENKSRHAEYGLLSTIGQILERIGFDSSIDRHQKPNITTRNYLAERLLEAYAQYGVTEAFEAMFALSAPSLTLMIREHLRPQTVSMTLDEIISETYWQIFRRAETFQPKGPRGFFNWALTIAHNVIRQESRRRSRQALRERAVAVKDLDPATDPLTRLLLREARLEEQTKSEQMVETLNQCLEDLAEQTRECLKLAAFDGLTYREIGERLGLSEAAVTMRIRRARQKACEKLAPKGSNCPRDQTE